MSEDFVPGQCWISDAELNLGVGIIGLVEFRHVNVTFPLCDEQRIYAKQTAPLTRLSFNVGDKLSNLSGEEITISSIDLEQGLFIYSGYTSSQKLLVIAEAKIYPLIKLNRPAQRLANAQIDSNLWFSLRHKTFSHQNKLAGNDLLSLTGCRTSLIPHQLYIAHNVASRYAPRVLLADEVGLGKTIEAGMILQHQLYAQRVKRVLIVVPETLIHQWLVEMHRRFNLRFSIFDEQRCMAEEQSSGMDNAFFTEQRVLCSLSFLTQSAKRMLQVLDGQWDMLIVDEAHHLLWTPEQSSLEYQCIEQLSKLTKAVLLLTATPEQLGKESHFARLRLLDPDRFPSFEKYLKDEASYKPIADLIEKIQSKIKLSAKEILQLETMTQQPLIDKFYQNSVTSHELIEHLLDRHGTGRVLFRNTRATVQGFPQRKHIAYPLDFPINYQKCLLAVLQSSISDPQLLLSLETLYLQQQQQQQQQQNDNENWVDFDGRIRWLGDLIKTLTTKKILIITAYAQTAKQLNLILKQKMGIHSAVFHEGLNLVERDRAAAYFAEEEGCNVLVCSEIGSEGRNFQFSHNLVLFDLPLNPDLLEQRIGRLDRIGQCEDIVLHIPYFKHSPQELMYHWYNQGLEAFEQSCPAAHQIYKKLYPFLIDLLHQSGDNATDNEIIIEQSEFIETSKQLRLKLNDILHKGRDRLLEFNSCRKNISEKLVEEAQKNDQNLALESYLEDIFEVLGVNSEPHKKNSFIIHPGEKMQLAISGLDEDGLTCTCVREIALQNEDMQFLNWTHPLVVDVMEQITSSEVGNTAIVMVSADSLYSHSKLNVQPGTLLLESIFIIESKLANIQYMFNLLTDINENELAQEAIYSLPIEEIQNIGKETIKNIINAYKDELKSMINVAENLAKQKSIKLIEQLFSKKLNALGEEKNRLEELQKINPAVRSEEIDFFNQQISNLKNNKDKTSVRLDAIRLIVVT